MADPLGKPRGIVDGDGAALGNAEQRKRRQIDGVDHCLEIADQRIKREIFDVPVPTGRRRARRNG